MKAFVKVLGTLSVVVVAPLPAWIYLAVRHLLSPDGFWQEFILLGAGLWVLGGLQVIFGLVGLFIVWLIWIFPERGY